MTLQRVPRVKFGLERPSVRQAHRELLAMLQRHLSDRFGPVETFRVFILPVSLMLKVDGNKFSVAFGRQRRKARRDYGEWIVAINPAAYPVPKKSLPKHEEKKYSRGLMLISDEIQTLLSNTPGVTRLRWFFEGWDIKKPAVRAPTELPWNTDVPEPEPKPRPTG